MIPKVEHIDNFLFHFMLLSERTQLQISFQSKVFDVLLAVQYLACRSIVIKMILYRAENIVSKTHFLYVTYEMKRCKHLVSGSIYVGT